jgi:RHS repeat-associated protein
VAAQTEIVEYYGHDALGSIRIVFTASGVATARADYEPFGEAVTIAGMPAGPLPAQQFTGQERDQLERQDYFGARYYRPRHGRFSQVDPVYAGLFDPQQWNRYAYARNNPLSFVDPTGEYTRDANSPGGYSCAEILKDNPGDALCNPFHAALVDPTTTLVSGVRVDVIDTRLHGGGVGRASRLAEFIDQHVVDLDAMPPGDSAVLELGLVVVEQNLLNLVTAPVAVLGLVDDAGKAATKVIQAANGTRITAFSRHGLNRAIGDGVSRAGVSTSAWLDALRQPQQVITGTDQWGRPFQIFVGADARVVVNPTTGLVVTMNPLSRRGVRGR